MTPITNVKDLRRLMEFDTKLYHLVYGKKYRFLPEEILRAPFGDIIKMLDNGLIFYVEGK